MIGAPVVAIVPSLFRRYLPCGSWQLLQASCPLGNVPPGEGTFTGSMTYPSSAATVLWAGVGVPGARAGGGVPPPRVWGLAVGPRPCRAAPPPEWKAYAVPPSPRAR